MAAASRTVLILLVVVLCTGCRFKSASVAEQQALITRGGFSGGAPAWSPRTVTGSAAGIPLRNSGGIPERYNPPAVAYGSNADNNRFASQVQEKRGRLIAEQAAGVEEDQGIVVDRDKSASPLDRIAKICPGIDTEAEEALVVENPSVRLSKYQELTRRCPLSEDLWTWQSREYLSAGNFAEAEKSARQALSINPDFKSAQSILNRITGQEPASVP